MDYSSLSQPWQAQQQKSRKIPLKRSASYFYAHHPENWEVVIYTKKSKSKDSEETINVPILLPVLSSIIEEAGVNGVRMNGSMIDSSVLQTRMKKSGWEMLDPEAYDYMRVYPAINGGYFYSNKFTKIENLAGRIIKTFNNEEYNQFRLKLMKDKHLSLPHSAIIQLMLIDQNRIILGLEQKQHTPEGANRLKQAYADHKNIEDAAARIKKLKEKAYVI